jgi:hypothetical protein
MFGTARGVLAVIVGMLLSHHVLAQGCPPGPLMVGSDAPKPRTIYVIDGGRARPMVGLNTFNLCVGNMNKVLELPSQQIATQWLAGDPYIAMGTFLCDDVGASDNKKPRCSTGAPSGPLCSTIYWMDSTTDVPRPFGDWGAYKNQGGPDCPEVPQGQGGVELMEPNSIVWNYVHSQVGSTLCTGACGNNGGVTLYSTCRAGADRCTLQKGETIDSP